MAWNRLSRCDEEVRRGVTFSISYRFNGVEPPESMRPPGFRKVVRKHDGVSMAWNRLSRCDKKEWPVDTNRESRFQWRGTA